MAQTEQQTSSKKKNAGRKNSIGDFFVEKVDGAVMRAFVEKTGIEVDTDVSDEQLAVALTLHFRGLGLPEEDFVKCERCDGEAPESEAICPFCGLKDVVNEPAPKVETSAAEEAIGEEEPGEVAEAKPEPPTENGVTHLRGRAKSEKAKKEGMAMTTTSTNGKGLAKTKGTGATVHHGEVVLKGTLTAHDLDEAIKQVVRARIDTAEGFIKQGLALREINEKQLWKLRLKADGKAMYRGFDSFVEHECNVTSTYAYDMIELAKNFTADQIQRIGRSKAIMMLKVPEEFRAEIEEKAVAGATKREIAEQVREIREKTGHKKKSRHAEAGAKGQKAQAKKREAKVAKDKITVAQIEGRKTIKLFKKPETLRGLDFKELKRAKTVGDQPFGRLELTNEVVMYLSFAKDKNDELVAIVDVRREAAADE